MQPSTTGSDKSMGFPDTRAAVRVTVRLDTTVDDGEMARMYQTHNLSSSGMLLHAQKPIPIGTRVAVQFLFPGDPMLSEGSLPGGYGFVEGEAIVVRHTHPIKEAIEGMALQFVALESQGRALLAQFLGRQQNGGQLGSSPA